VRAIPFDRIRLQLQQTYAIGAALVIVEERVPGDVNRCTIARPQFSGQILDYAGVAVLNAANGFSFKLIPTRIVAQGIVPKC
jgi:hypothetical protein